MKIKLRNALNVQILILISIWSLANVKIVEENNMMQIDTHARLLMLMYLLLLKDWLWILC